MKCIIVDFVSISFVKFRVHGGGDFALRAVEYLISNGKKFFIINNSTEYFKEYSLSTESDLKTKLSDVEEAIYFNPLYQGGNNEALQYSDRLLYIHGLRMLEMPYDSTSYRYFKFPENLKTWFKERFFKNHYGKTGQNLLQKVDSIAGKKVILTPSEHSKYMMKSAYSLETEVKVLPPFLNSKELDSDIELPTQRDYILMLNGDRWVKNSYRFLSAFKELKKQGELRQLDLVMIGTPPFSDAFHDNNVIYLDYVDRGYLEKLMRNCFFLAYPSLNEGFGYPPLDVFKHGKPVLSTALSSPNILYNGYVVFTNPYSVDEIKSRILYLIDNYDLYCKGEKYYNEINEIIEMKWSQIF